MTTFAITTAEIGDAPAILALQYEAYQSEARLYDDWRIPPLTQTLDELVGEFHSGIVLKATAGAALLGSVRARQVGGTAHIGRLCVAPDMQRRGIGGALLGQIEAAFPAAERYELFTGSRSEGNIRLYQRNGYAVIREQRLSENVTLVFLGKPNEITAHIDAAPARRTP